MCDNSTQRCPKVSIIILNWNGVKDTIKCLESLEKINYQNYDVIVVDNGSEGDDVDILKEKYGNSIHLIENEKNYGAAEGRNIGIRYALKRSNPDYVMLIDNDIVVDVEFLNQLVRIAENNKKIGILGSKNYEVAKREKRTLIAKLDSYAILGFRRERKKVTDELLVVDYVSSCAILVRRGLLDEIGFFDSKFFYLGEDYDLCKRAKKAGNYVAIALKSRVWHKKTGGVSRKSSTLVYYFRTRNYLLIMRKHGSFSDWLRFLPFYTFNFLIRLIFYSFKGKTEVIKALIKGLYDGIFEPL